MQWYEKINQKIKCLLCAQECKIASGGVGICGVNKNIGDKLECLVYGYPQAINIDPIEKKPLYHFLPQSKTFSLGTIGCNFRCPFCQNWELSQSDRIDKRRFVSPKEIISSALFHECKSISFTYNEPTIFYPYAKDIAIMAKKNNLKTVFVTNGFMSKEVIEDMKGCIDAFNIDIKSFNHDYYKKELKANLQTVLDNAIALKKNGHWVEITTLLIPQVNDSKKEIAQIAEFISSNLGTDTPWHLSAFHPDYKQQNTPKTPKESLKEAKKIAKEYNLHYCYLGNITYKNKTKCPSCSYCLMINEGFETMKNEIQNGCCPNCKAPIAGVFE